MAIAAAPGGQFTLDGAPVGDQTALAARLSAECGAKPKPTVMVMLPMPEETEGTVVEMAEDYGCHVTTSKGGG